MPLLQLVLKNMRQRALSTWLTLLSVILGVSLAVVVFLVYRGGNAIFGQSDFGYDILMGPPKGSGTELVLNTVYGLGVSSGLLPYQVYEDLLKDRANVKLAIPWAVGDSYKGLPLAGTSPKYLGFDDTGKKLPDGSAFEYRLNKRFELAEGRVFPTNKFEAVLGSEVTQRAGLKMGDRFKATHGMPRPDEKPDIHDAEWTVVGILKQTHTAADRVIYIPLMSFYAIAEHEEALEIQGNLRAGLPENHHNKSSTPASTGPATDEHDDHEGHNHADHAEGGPDEAEHDHAHDHDHDHEEKKYEVRADGTIDLKLPKEDWQLSAIFVRSRGGAASMGLMYKYKVIDNRASAINPASEMRKFFANFFEASRLVLLVIAVLVSMVAAVGILVSIYNSVSARTREIAILRALGATRGKVMGVICLEAIFIGLAGAVGGIILGHLMGAVASKYMERLIGEGFDWLTLGREEMLYLVGIVVLSALAGLVPARLAYRTPVAANLVSG